MGFSGLGIDIVPIKDFVRFSKKRDSLFLSKNFTEREIDYCFSFRDPSPHLAGNFAAKEAVFKALGNKKIIFSSLEIIRKKDGSPFVRLNDRLLGGVLVSIAHAGDFAVAIATKKK